MKEKGFIYILTNDSMPGLIKIGITNRPIKERLRELDSTEVPTPFNLYYAIEVEDYKNREKLIHQAYNKDRIRPNREFFKVEPESAVALLKAIGGKEISPEYINISVDESGNLLSTDTYDSKLPPSINTTFDMLQIAPQTELTFTRNDDLICKVLDDRKVEYNGSIYSLSALTTKILQEKYNWKSKHVNGFHFWKYENEILADRRARLEHMNEEDFESNTIKE